MEDGNYYRVYYKKDDDKVTCGEIVKVFMEDVTEAEHQSLETIRALTNNNLESVSETFAELDKIKGEIESLTQEKNDLCTKIETKDGELSTLQMEKDTISSQKDSLEQDYNSLKNEFELLQTEKETLENYKNEIERSQKMAAIDNYSLLLEKEVLDSYKEKVDEFDTLESLEKDLAYNYVKTQQVNNFAKVKPIIPVTNPQQDELTNILNKYKKED